MLSLTAINQLLVLISIFWFTPEGWTAILGLPLTIARIAAAFWWVILAIAAVMCWIREEQVTRILHILRQVWRSKIGYVLMAAGAGTISLLLAQFYESRWSGFALLGVEIGLGLVALYLSEPGHWQAEAAKFWQIVPLGAIIVGLGLRYWLMRVDVIWVDEAYRLSAIANWMQGNGLTPIMAQYPPGIVGPPWRGNAIVLYAWWTRVAGFSLMSLRMFSYLAGLLTLPVIYRIAALLYDQRSAWVTTSLAALSLLLMRSTTAREDALSMLLMSIALLIHLYACQHQGYWRHVLVGVAGGLALEGHLTNLTFFGAVGGYYLVTYIQGIRRGEKWLRSDALWFFLIGSALALGIYLLTHLFLMGISLERFVAALSTGTKDSSLSSAGSFAVWRLNTTLGRLAVLWRFSISDSLLIVASLVAAGLRRSKGDRHWLLLFVFMQIGYLLVEINGTVRHTLYGLAIWVGASGALLVRRRDVGKQWPPVWGRIGYSALLLAMLGTALGYIRVQDAARQYTDAERAPIVAYIQEHTSSDDWIIASAVYFVYLPDHPNFLRPVHPIGSKAPALTGVDPDTYWLDILLDTWPMFRISRAEGEGFPVARSYMDARHATQVIPRVWQVQREVTTNREGYCQANIPAIPQMVAYAEPQPELEPGSPLYIETIWITRRDVEHDFAAQVALVNEAGTPVVEATVPLISGWAKTVSGEWLANQFHDVSLVIDLPDDLRPGKYGVQITALSGPSGEIVTCRWGVTVQIGE